MFKISEELLFKISILIAFAIYFYLSLQFPSIPMQEGYGAGLFPIIISISFFLFAIKDFFTKNKQEFNKKENLVLLGFLIIIFIPMYFINFLGMYFVLGLFLFYFSRESERLINWGPSWCRKALKNLEIGRGNFRTSW